MECTFVLVKPDGIQRGLLGAIISRFENAGLVIEELQQVRATSDMIRRHYPDTESWLRTVGGKTMETYERYGMDPIQEIGTSDDLEVGRRVKEWLVQYLTSGPVVALVLRGNHAVDAVRKLVGETIPLFSAPGTIRGDYGMDSPDLANAERRAVTNLIHASGTVEEAQHEIALWFPQS